jgi:hypothetical protein
MADDKNLILGAWVHDSIKLVGQDEGPFGRACSPAYACLKCKKVIADLI